MFQSVPCYYDDTKSLQRMMYLLFLLDNFKSKVKEKVVSLMPLKFHFDDTKKV
tara:strand:- start:3483 stop:3641 length:159 start_codon:yes stop_codon:yes gene_type:complete